MSDDVTFYVTGTATLSWFDKAGQLHIRVYTSNGDTVVERCNDGQGWTNGLFSARGQNVSATHWADSAGDHLRVYCSLQGVTTEWCNDPGTSTWTKGTYTGP